MTLLYMFGLAAGSLVAYSLENILSPVQEHPCGAPADPLQSKIDAVSNSTADSILNSAPSTGLINILSSYIMSTVVELNTTDINK